MLRKATFLTTLGALALAGCADPETVLPGERLNVRDVLQADDPYAEPAENLARAISLPATQVNADWAQSPVSPFARVPNAALGQSLQQIWAVSIGAGDGRRQRLNADPVVAGGRIYTIDSEHVVRAVSTAGAVLWSHDLTPLRDGPEQAQGGGLAFAQGRVYAASGFGTLTALDPATGAEVWTQRLGETATGAPTVRDGVVYIVAGDSTAWALEADTGRIRWQIEGSGDANNVAGAPAPAVGDKHVVFSYGDSAVQAAFRQGGLQIWTADILGRRNAVALAGIDDVTGDPLIAGGVVYAGTHSGRTVAFSIFDGERLWTARQGALGPLWPAGDSVFFVSDRNQLIRLDAASGAQIWAVDLPGYVPTRRPNRKRDRAFTNHGPALAGGRLVVAGSDGLIRSFAPGDGRLVSTLAIDGGATTRPVVAGGVMYVVSKKGVLHAFR